VVQRQRGTDRSRRTSAVIGLPVIPPAWASAWVTVLRSWLARGQAAVAPAPLRIVEAMLSSLDAAALAALCQLGIPDNLDGSTTVAELAARVGADADDLGRLVVYGAARGFLRLDRRGRPRPNAVTRFLRTDHPGGWRAWVDFTGSPDVRASIARLGDAIATGQGAFELANGASFFDRAATDQALGESFDAAMAAGGRLHGLALAEALDWSDTRRVADIGGGTGALLGELVGREPHLEGVLLDLAPVIGRAVANPAVEAIAGDAFLAVPGDCDAYLLVNVLHDWGDDDAARLLQRVATDSPPAARVIVVERVRRVRPVDDLATRSDLLMLALAPGGRERTRAEFEALARRTGLTLVGAVALASADWAFTFVHTDPR
jgi:2,7-dihydroxy-5-methyl-1-naphthoate 7-O-methyltransferase